MRKKEIQTEQTAEVIRNETVSEVLRDNFMPYAMSVIVSRAIPDVSDGLKPSHRKVLYTMYEMGLMGSTRTKSANVAARTMLYNPHGDAGNYETMVRMTQNNETLLTPIVDGKGSFGKHYSRDLAAAASRYTEAKLMPVATEFFSSIRKNTVDFVDNYDSTRKEPVVLPVTFPNILANPTEGIAVGMASSIPSFNLSELCDATILHIQDPSADIMEVMPGPDFATGAYILYEKDAMRAAYETGKGSIRMRAKYQIDKAARIIEITEIPYTTTAEAVIEGVISLVKSGKINEITDIRNEIDLNGFKIAIDYKRSADPEALMKKLFRITKLQDTYSFNMTVLVDGHPRVLGVSEILDEWTKSRRGCVKRELQFDYEKKSHELHLLEGLQKVLLDIDKAIRIIRETDTDEEVIGNLMNGFSVDEEQAVYIAEIKLRNLNKDYILSKTSAITKLKKEVSDLHKQINSAKSIDKIIIEKLKEVKKKYGIPRKTEIVRYEADEASAACQDVPDYPVNVYITKENYVKKIALTSLKTSPEIKVKEGDEIIRTIQTTNSNELLVFTDKCNVYKTGLSEMKDSKPSELGDVAGNLADLEPGENVIYITALTAGKSILIAFENGKIARFPLSVYETLQNRKKLKSAFSNKSPVVAIHVISEEEDFGIAGSKNHLLCFNSKMIAEKTTKTTQGVQVLRMRPKETAVSFHRIGLYGLESLTGYGCRALPGTGGKYPM